MELRQLRSFCTVADLGSFTRAAKALGYAQPTITTQVQMLEAELGQKLLDRIGRHVRLTEPGGVLKRYADQIIALNEEAFKALEGLSRPQGKLTIGASESICALRLPAVLAEYATAYPQVRVCVQCGYRDELLARVLDHRLDLAIVAGAVSSENPVVYERLFDEPLALICGSGCSVVTQGSRVDLCSMPWISVREGSAYREQLDSLVAQARRPLNYVVEVWGVDAVRANVIAGLGLALLPVLAVATDLQEGRLSRLEPPNGQSLHIPIGIMRHQTSYLTPALSRFIDIARSRLTLTEMERPLAQQKT